MIGNPFPFDDFLVVTGTAAGVVVALMVLTAVLARITGRVSVVDTVWGLGFVAVTFSSVLLGRHFVGHTSGGHAFDAVHLSGPPTLHNAFADHDHRTWLILILVTIWGGRLAWHIGKRSHGAAEDPRYEELMANGPGGLIRKVLLPQGLAIWFVSLPIQVSVVSGWHHGGIVVAGVVLWTIGLAFESIGDAQLAAYKKDPDRGPVMDRGLWRYTRHPNYFGDACVWWGIYLVCASSWPGIFTILSPIAMTYFLVFATGARLLERTMMQRPGYPEYAAKTSMFFPRPPKTR